MTPDLVVHVPHASLHLPPERLSEFLISKDELLAEATASADLYTDRLAHAAWPDAQIIEAPVSRIIVDVERFEDDALEEMVARGRGVIYTHNHAGERIRADVPPEVRENLLETYYRPHWQRLRSAARGAVLIDLHSYPKSPWPVEGQQTAQRPEIDLGFTDGLTSPSWIASLSKHFEDRGYEVGHNTPYAGVIDAGASEAVMIEIRRDVLGTPGTRPGWRNLVETLKKMPLPQS